MDLYDEEILYTDRQIAHLISWLRSASKFQNTLFYIPIMEKALGAMVTSAMDNFV